MFISKKIWLLPIALLAVSCSNKDLDEVEEPVVTNELKSLSADSYFRWNVGESIPYYFMNGSAKEQAIVEDCMEEWMKYANVKFVEASSFNSAIVRIKIYADNGSNVKGSAALGKYYQVDYNKKNPNSPTVNLYISGVSRSKAKTIVLHELGHVLGLADETYHKDFNVSNLNTSLIRNEIGTTLYEQLFGAQYRDIYQKGICYENSAPFNPNSIMMYNIPSRWTKNGTSYDGGVELTPQDIWAINKMYPFSSKYVAVYAGSEGDNGAILGRFTNFSDWTKIRKFVGYGFETEQTGTYPVTKFKNSKGECRMGMGRKNSSGTIVWDQGLQNQGFYPVSAQVFKPIYMYYSHGYGRTPVEVYYKNGKQMGYSYCFDSYLTGAGYTRPGSPLALVETAQ
ncbi:MAG: M12 family metallopeptidase [Paludibacteraceae bacterium]|nr:M12 family metallopeptidase [Paludibacteraceae bacterium]